MVELVDTLYPKHLYWGTAQENRLDQGHNTSPWDRMIEKYGYEEACRMNAKGKKGNTNGSGNKDKPKSEDQKKKISESIKLHWEKRKGQVA